MGHVPTEKFEENILTSCGYNNYGQLPVPEATCKIVYSFKTRKVIICSRCRKQLKVIYSD